MATGGGKLSPMEQDLYNAGPAALTLNALGAVLVTYIVSFSQLNVTRALKAYDARVPSIGAPPSQRGGDASTQANRSQKPRIIASLSLISLYAVLFLTYYNSDKSEISRFVFESLIKLICSAVAYLGFSMLPGIRGRAAEVFRIYSMEVRPCAIPETSRIGGWEDSMMFRRALALFSIYAGVYPNAWLSTLASLGLASSMIRCPLTPGATVSIRGTILFFASIPIMLAIMFGLAGYIVVNEEGASNRSQVLHHNPWSLVSLQMVGTGLGYLTALVLRYEHSASDVAETPLARSHPVSTTSPAPKEASVVTAGKVTPIPREPVPQDRPQFAKPLFYTLLLTTFLVHIPAIVISMPSAAWIRESELNPMWMRITAQALLILPAQLWMVVVFPIVIVIARMVRSDGTAMWRYSEMVFRPIEDKDVESGTARISQPQVTDEKLLNGPRA